MCHTHLTDCRLSWNTRIQFAELIWQIHMNDVWCIVKSTAARAIYMQHSNSMCQIGHTSWRLFGFIASGSAIPAFTQKCGKCGLDSTWASCRAACSTSVHWMRFSKWPVLAFSMESTSMALYWDGILIWQARQILGRQIGWLMCRRNARQCDESSIQQNASSI